VTRYGRAAFVYSVETERVFATRYPRLSSRRPSTPASARRPSTSGGPTPATPCRPS